MGDYILEEIDKKFEEYEVEMKRRQKLLSKDADYVRRTDNLLSEARKMRIELNTGVTIEDKKLDAIFYKYFPFTDDHGES